MVFAVENGCYLLPPWYPVVPQWYPSDTPAIALPLPGRYSGDQYSANSHPPLL